MLITPDSTVSNEQLIAHFDFRILWLTDMHEIPFVPSFITTCNYIISNFTQLIRY